MTCQIPAHVHLNPFPYIPFYMIVILDSNTSFLSIYFLIPLVVQLLSCAQLFAVPWTEAHQASLPFTLSQSLLKLMSTTVVLSNHLILCRPLLLLLSIFHSIRVFFTESASLIRQEIRLEDQESDLLPGG